MSVQILATKLYIPPPRPKIVLRPRLVERLNEGLHHKLTLVSAPAGFGKTSLLSEWITTLTPNPSPSGRGVRGAWLSLDEEDKDIARFLMYLVAALQTVAPNVGEELLAVLQSPQLPPTESILTTLVNEITALPGEFILILDDYHTVDSKLIDKAITFLLEYQPPQLHLLISTREDPQLPLARYRAQGQLTELRQADLRFSPADTAAFFNQTMGLNLTTQDIVALEERTEGWIAGLQLAAISMKGHQDTFSFIQSFTGSHRFVMDYLVEEVLKQQPQHIQNFLLYTSILDRLCGPLCDAVALDLSASGQEKLEYLERANLFVISLDNERRWYRYHQLFADLLRNRLKHLFPDQLVELHRRASDWYLHNDFPNEAVTHALTIQDWPRAAEIIEQFSDIWPMRGEINILLGWLESFPAEMLIDRPSLGLIYAWVLYMANQWDRADQLLSRLMPVVQTAPPLLGEVFAIRVMIAANRNDMSAVIALAREALLLVPPDEASPRSRILLSLGVVQYDRGDIAAARDAFSEAFELGTVAFASNRSVGNAPLPLAALAYLADIERLQGHLGSSSRMVDQAFELVEQWGGQASIALCLLHRGKAALLYEWNDLDGAAGALQESIRIGELWKNAYLLVPAFGMSAMVMLARGQVDEALSMIHRAEKLTRHRYSFPADTFSLVCYQLALWIAQNDDQAISEWEQRYGSEWQSQTGRTRETITISLAQAQIARYHQQHDVAALDQARTLIQPGLELAQASGLMYNAARLLILEALASYAQGAKASAITALKRALAIAEPENYVRSFLDLGMPMQAFLSWSLESQSVSEPHLRVYVTKLLSHFDAEITTKSHRPTDSVRRVQQEAPLEESLTDRELEVLRLIALGLSNREISERLFLAESTVKGHNRIIFDKLQVQRRTEAVARARDLGLL